MSKITQHGTMGLGFRPHVLSLRFVPYGSDSGSEPDLGHVDGLFLPDGGIIVK